MGEFDLIERYFAAPAAALMAAQGKPQRPLLGIGDDCAMLASLAPKENLVVSTDTLVQGAHFFADVSPFRLGHKAVAVNLSDLAAMGAEPLGFTLALTLPQANDAWLGEFSRGVFALARKYQCPLVGGDTTKGPLSITITVFGKVQHQRCLRRGDARHGDDIWVSGNLGAAAMAVSDLYSGKDLAEDNSARLLLEMPEPRVALGRALVEQGLSRCAMDLSDGIASDLPKILKASGLAGARIELMSLPLGPGLAKLPTQEALKFALSGGDDYELLFCAGPDKRLEIAALGKSSGLALTKVGEIDAALQGLSVVDELGVSYLMEDYVGAGFDHFA